MDTPHDQLPEDLLRNPNCLPFTSNVPTSSASVLMQTSMELQAITAPSVVESGQSQDEIEEILFGNQSIGVGGGNSNLARGFDGKGVRHGVGERQLIKERVCFTCYVERGGTISRWTSGVGSGRLVLGPACVMGGSS
jgi:hypothetical protein